MTAVVYVALGGNIGDTDQIFHQALQSMTGSAHDGKMECSRFYRTVPVSALAQENFLNAVCRFLTSLTPDALHKELQRIEVGLGKEPKPKESPRKIDLDLLFYGNRGHQRGGLKIPHYAWKERAFVLIPLLDLTDTIEIAGFKYNIPELIKALPMSDSGIIDCYSGDVYAKNQC